MSVDNTIVTLDDGDPQLKWSGAWFTTAGIVDDLSNYGPPFLGTFHGISNNGSLVIPFYGRVVGIWGALKPRNTSLGPDPDWQCLLDGQDVGHPVPYPDGPISNYMLCGTRLLPEGNHTLQLNTVIRSEPLYVDQVQYQAAATAKIADVWTQVIQRDGRIKYSPGWEENGLFKYTYTPGAWLTFDFVGTGIIWGGYTPDTSTVGQGSAQYLIDNKAPPTDFYIPSRSGTFTNQPYFNISGLSPGPHRLQVTNTGNVNTAPLGLTYIYLKNPPDVTQPPPRNKGKIIGGAVGGSVGAIILIIVALTIFILRRRRNQQQQGQEAASVGGTIQGRPFSMVSGSTVVKEQLTPGSPTQGNWVLNPNPNPNPSHSPQLAPSTGAFGPTPSFANPTSSYHPGANLPNTFVPPSGSIHTFVTHSSPQPGPAMGILQPRASTSFTPMSAQPPIQQMVWPTPRHTPVQHTQDGRLDEGDFNPYR